MWIMNVNFTLIIGVILLILGVQGGFKTGLVKGIAHLVALMATILTLALIIMLTSSFKAGETKNTIFTLIIMAILGGVYSLVKFCLRSFKSIAKLPILKFADKILGIFAGVLWVFALYMTLIALGVRGYLGSVSEVVINDVNTNLFLTILCKYNIFL